MDPIELCKQIGLEFNVVVDDDYADYIIWERTGFPAFYDENDLIYGKLSKNESLMIQIRKHFIKHHSNEPKSQNNSG
jgi:hypothetical protein